MMDIEGMDLVESELGKSLDCDIHVLSCAANHIVSSGGKRIRPALVLLSYEALGGKDVKHAVPIATTAELIHTATLVHDDINDRSDTRRGKPSVNAVFGESIALLTGDFIFTRLFSLVSHYDSSVLKTFADSCVHIVEGETQQLMTLGNIFLKEDVYLRIVAKKTASLFSACTRTGGMLAHGEERLVGALGRYGLDIGMAFQIKDDMLDMMGQNERLGKPTASDIKQKKMSIATIHAVNNFDGASEIIMSGNHEKIKELCRKTGSIDYGLKKAREYAHNAKKELSILQESDAKDRLLKMADMVVSRDF